MSRHRHSLLAALSFGLASATVGSFGAASARAADGLTRPADGVARPANDDWFRRDMDHYGERFGPASYGYGGYGNNGDYPYGVVNDWVTANARAATARAIFRRAENELAASYRAAQHRFETNPDYMKAMADERTAYQALTEAQNKALRSVSQDPRYQALMAMRQDLSDKLQARRAANDVTPAEVLAIATLRLNYGTDLRAMESGVMKDDADIKKAQQELVDSGRRVTELRGKNDEEVRTDSDIRQARRNLEDARIAKITAEAFLYGTATAGDLALNYTYYRSNGPSNFDPYYGGGYGGGYRVRY